MDRVFKNPSTTAARQSLKIFGVAAEYYPLAGGRVAVDVDGNPFMVWFKQLVRLQVEGYEGLTTLRAKTIEAIREDIAAVDFKGYFLIDSVQYQIVDTIDDETERIIFQVK